MKKVLFKRLLSAGLILFASNISLAEDKAKKAPTRYIPLDPPIVVNVSDQGSGRFLQVTAQVSVNTPNAEEHLQTHMGPIRHEMIMMLSEQQVADISTPKGKEKLRKESLTAIQKILMKNTGKKIVNAVFFTGFIIQ